MNLFSIPAHLPFLDALAAEWLADTRARGPLAAADGLILLPTRRAARALAEAFLRASEGRALLLPRITAIGALDEAPLALAGTLALPPSVEPAQRLAALSRLILAMQGHDGAPRTADRAWRLGGELASLMDEAERAEIDLAARLPDAADPQFAQHWAQTLAFLRVVTEHWPLWLAEQGVMNPAARQVALLNAQAAAWQADPPAYRVLVAGATAAIPAIARLAGVVARLPAGSVVLPGLDDALSEAAWAALEASHPQAGLAALLHGMGAARGDVRPWPVTPPSRVPASRVGALRRALLPGAALAEDWTDTHAADTPGLWRLEPADQQEEAASVALVLRDALEALGARAALVTPDRALADRVAAELLRWGIVADDSAGEALAETPPAVFLRLLARAVTEELAPVPLLALLKHPLAAAGLSTPACRAGARALELACLRGPRPLPGLTGLRLGLERAPVALRIPAGALLAQVEDCLAPALRFAANLASAPAEALAGVIEAAERLAATDQEGGPARLWADEEGEALSAHLSAVLDAMSILPEQPRAVLPGLLDAVLASGPAVRTRRALRGRGGSEHPRLFIWGLLEARLQAVDVLVLGGLAEGVWPPAAEPGPWLSRPMRARVGLPTPEEAVGQAAHDFAAAACAAPSVILSCPRRLDGAPAVPARWLTRLEMFLAGRGAALPRHPAAGWARALDQPAALRPVGPPAPCPAIARRPRRLSVTEIETWLRDPYAIHARHILRVRALAPLEQDTDAADYGSMVHDGLHNFLAEVGSGWPDDARARLRHHLLRTMTDAGLREALRNWWAPRLERIADWVAETEGARRGAAVPHGLSAEVTGSWDLLRPGGRFTLTGRADRIERLADGRLAILDYKTGTPPGPGEVASGLAPQLPLEAAMAQAGAFGPDLAGEAAELAYWHITGGFVPGKMQPLFKSDPTAIAAAAQVAADALGALIDAFDDPARCYLSQPHPGRAPRFSDYAQLARVVEWAAVGDGEGP